MPCCFAIHQTGNLWPAKRFVSIELRRRYAGKPGQGVGRVQLQPAVAAKGYRL